MTKPKRNESGEASRGSRRARKTAHGRQTSAKASSGRVGKGAPRAPRVIEAIKAIGASLSDSDTGSHTTRGGFLIHDVSRLRRTIYDQRLKPYGITRSQWWVMANLSRRNCDGMTQIDLARLLEVGKVTLGGLIDRLEQGDFVVRMADKVDRRTKRIFRSSKGVELCKRMEIFAHKVNDEIFEGISVEEQQKLIEVLSKMKRNLIAMDALPLSHPRNGEGRSTIDEDT
jgi:MarR family transcriptional regulator for hemolysin